MLRFTICVAVSVAFPFFASPSSADGYDGPENIDYNGFVNLLISKLTTRMKPELYPDLGAKRRELVDEMPLLTDNIDSKNEFKKLKNDLKAHGKKIEDFREELQDVCTRLDVLDAYARKEMRAARLVRSDEYDEVVKPWINSTKSRCLTATKSGPYWSLYTEALDLLQSQTDSIPEAEAECRDRYPERC